MVLPVVVQRLRFREFGLGCNDGSPRDGGSGGDGCNGAAGLNGTGGLSMGSFLNNAYVASNGGHANDGAEGGGGGGGGAGGGENCEACFFGACTCISCGTGQGGGGGGGGGRGGDGGSGGGGGGASIGIYLRDSSVSIENVRVETAQGGDGGAGGLGGNGGRGGDGGAPAVTSSDRDGNGGRGGNGGGEVEAVAVAAAVVGHRSLFGATVLSQLSSYDRQREFVRSRLVALVAYRVGITGKMGFAARPLNHCSDALRAMVFIAAWYR